jgi:hypothetical protein
LRARNVTTVSGKITTWQMASTSIIVGISPSRPDASRAGHLFYARRLFDRVRQSEVGNARRQVLTGSLLNG